MSLQICHSAYPLFRIVIISCHMRFYTIINMYLLLYPVHSFSPTSTYPKRSASLPVAYFFPLSQKAYNTADLYNVRSLFPFILLYCQLNAPTVYCGTHVLISIFLPRISQSSCQFILYTILLTKPLRPFQLNRIDILYSISHKFVRIYYPMLNTITLTETFIVSISLSLLMLLVIPIQCCQQIVI